MEDSKLFYYNAYDARRGAIVRGGWWASSSEEVEYWLEQQGYSDETVWSGSRTPQNIRPNRKAMALFYRQLSVLFSSGSSLDRALQFASYSEDRNVAAIANSLSHKVSEGHRLSNAMRAYPSAFSTVILGLVGAGEQSGGLGVTLHNIADAEERATQLEGEVKAALTYPAVLGCVTLLVTGFFVFYVLPMDQEIFGGLGIELPLLNRLLLKLVGLLNSTVMFSLLIGMIAAGTMVFRREQLRKKATRTFLRVLRSMPVVNVIVHEYRSAQHLQVMALLLRGGGNIVQALKCMASTCILPEERKLIDDIRIDIVNGGDFGEALESSVLFNPTITALLSTGHEVGGLEQMAYRAQKICQESVQSKLEVASALLEPLLMAAAGVVAGFVVITSALPMLQLIENL
jgi:type II secretory pathway component PulF